MNLSKQKRSRYYSEALQVGASKSFGQLVDALLYALKYAGSKQIIFRRTYPELLSSIIRVSLQMYPREVCEYKEVKKSWEFKNGSIIDFGYCQYENDVYDYQSAEYDVIRFDELTHFTEFMYVYLISRCRGANDFPKHIKSSTNPGGIGHVWVKERFVDLGEPNVTHEVKLEDGDTETRIFIPSFVQDNNFLMEKDPKYISRLKNLPEKERAALLKGNWDIFEGQFFSEFDEKVHVCNPFRIPSGWRIYRTRDYGLDMCAVYWVAQDYNNELWVFRELHEANLTVSEAAEKINDMTNEKISVDYAPPDLWNRNRDTGMSTADIFAKSGQYLTKSDNNRITGWLAMHEWLRVVEGKTKLHIFSTCVHLIKSIKQIQHDERNPNDTAQEPHIFTHANDAMRYLCCMFQSPMEEIKKEPEGYYTPSEKEDLGFQSYSIKKTYASVTSKRR